MELRYDAAVLHRTQSPLAIEMLSASALRPKDVLVKIGAAGVCHTDLEVIEGSLRYPLPMILGHEAAGVVVETGLEAKGVAVGDHVVLSWNPHCSSCFYCGRDLPILCEDYQARAPAAYMFDGESRATMADGRQMRHLMFLGAFSEYCIVADQQAIPVSKDIPFDRACLIGCGVMTGVGAAINLKTISYGDTVMVVGCGAVGLSAVQGARMAGAREIIAVDLSPDKLAIALRLGATRSINASNEDVVQTAKQLTQGRGADAVIEAAGSAVAFRATMEAVRPGGSVIWLGKLDRSSDLTFRWGSLMQEKRIRRVSYGNARPRRDFPMLAEAYLNGDLLLDEMVTQRLPLEAINSGFHDLRAGKGIRSVVVFD